MNAEEKNKKQSVRRICLCAAVIMLVSAGIFYWIAFRGEYSYTLHQLAVLLIYPAGVLVIVTIFSNMPAVVEKVKLKAAERKAQRKAREKKKGHGIKNLPVLRFVFKRRAGSAGKDVSESEGEEVSSELEELGELERTGIEELKSDDIKAEDAEGLERDGGTDGLIAINRLPEEGEDKEQKENSPVLRTLFILVQAIFAGLYLYYAFSMKLPITNGYFAFSYIHAVLMLVLAVAMLVTSKIIRSYFGDSCSCAADFLTLCGAIILISAVAVMMEIMFKLEICMVFYWVYRIIGILLVLDFAAALAVSVIKKSVLSDFDYCLLPSRNRSNSFISVLEENTGISLKSLWSIKYLKRIAPGIVLGLAALLFLSTTVYSVDPQQQAAVYRFGRLDRESVVGPGIHMKLPWPIDKVEFYDVDRTSSIQIGYSGAASADFFWTLAHEQEYTLLLGGGKELASINMKLLYRIDDLYAYLTNVSSPEDILTAKAYEILMDRTVNTDMDELLTVNRSDFSITLTEELDRFCDESGLGLTVTESIMQSIHPPIQVVDVYQGVINASLRKNAMIIDAGTEESKALIMANKISETAILEARTNQRRRVSDAEYEMSIYYSALEAWKTNPDSFMLNKYLRTFETVVGGSKVYLFMPGTDEDMSRYIFGASNFGSGTAAGGAGTTASAGGADKSPKADFPTDAEYITDGESGAVLGYAKTGEGTAPETSGTETKSQVIVQRCPESQMNRTSQSGS